MWVHNLLGYVNGAKRDSHNLSKATTMQNNFTIRAHFLKRKSSHYNEAIY